MYQDRSIFTAIMAYARPRSERHSFEETLSQSGINLSDIDMTLPENILALNSEYFRLLFDKDNSSDREAMRVIFDLEHELTPVLARMEAGGVFLDRSLLDTESVNLRRRIEDLKKTIFFSAWEEFNISSSKQLQVILFEKLWLQSGKKNKTGYSVDAEVLEFLQDKHPIILPLLEYRTLTKLQTTYFDVLPRSISPRTNRIHPTYIQIGAATGRIACEDPNLQNIPAHGEGSEILRRAFRPEDSHTVYVVADFSQMELKILANLSGDQAFQDAFLAWGDIHQRTAEFLFGHTNISWDERRIAKAVNFGVIYGVSGFGLMKTTGLSRKDADSFIKAFYDAYPGVWSYYERLLEWVRTKWYAETFLGRRRWIDGINDSNKMLRSAAEREAMNMPIQGTGADVLKLSLIKADRLIRELFDEVKMVMNIHDEIVFEVPRFQADAFCEKLREILVYKDLGPIPLNVDIGVGENWWEAK